MDCSLPGSEEPLSPWDFPGKSTGVGLPFPSPGDLPNPGIEPGSPALQADALPSEPPGNLMIFLPFEPSDFFKNPSLSGIPTSFFSSL